MRRLFSVFGIFLICIFGVFAYAARFPNAVERRFLITGRAATEIAQLFQIRDSQSSTELKLGRSDAWAVYLLKQDTPEKLFNDERMPTRVNRLEYSEESVPSLLIYPFWLDESTQLPRVDNPGFRFSSHFVAEDLVGDDGWTVFLRKFKHANDWSKNNQFPFERCYRSDDTTEICFQVYKAVDPVRGLPGYQASVLVRP